MRSQARASDFTIGVCASDSATNLPSLLSLLRSERFEPEFSLRRIVVVASGCPANILSIARNIARADSRLLLVTEPERRGKAEAINRIVESSAGRFLVLVNSDAVPESGSILKLLSVAAADDNVGCVSACPVFDQGAGLFQGALGLMWSAHNMMSLRLNHANLSNHSSDELLVVRSELMSRLPTGLINDGAYLGGLARSRGLQVRFCEDARVRISVPRRSVDLIEQRRRILFGHIQVWKELGDAPRTMETLLFTKPLLSLGLLVALLRRQPRSIVALPVVVTSELLSAILVVVDSALSSDRHAVWRRFE